MSALKNLQKIQQKNRSMICLGLDLDPKKMPQEYANSMKGMFDFAHRIIDATADQVCAYKPNLAFYEAMGPEGLSLLKLIRERIPEEIPVIMDGKRGDIGNTAGYYADAMYGRFGADWVTLSPYMGYDSLRPFLEHKDKGVFVLCLTSNTGAKDFQLLDVEGKPLYMVVAERVHYWNKEQNCGLVVGATHPDQLREIRAVSGEMPLLIPGVGAQGGSLEEAATLGTEQFHKPAVINVSRSVLYASIEKDFAMRARQELEKLNSQVSALRSRAPKPEAAAPSAAATPSVPATPPPSAPSPEADPNP
jgi:orotidine-5'-phosphate decarboxylase